MSSKRFRKWPGGSASPSVRQNPQLLEAGFGAVDVAASHKGAGLIVERRLQAPLGRRDRGRAAPPPLWRASRPNALGFKQGSPRSCSEHSCEEAFEAIAKPVVGGAEDNCLVK